MTGCSTTHGRRTRRRFRQPPARRGRWRMFAFPASLSFYFPHGEQRVVAGGPHFRDGDIALRPADGLEELAPPVGLNVRRESPSGTVPAETPAGDLQACPDAGKLGVEEARVR